MNPEAEFNQTIAKRVRDEREAAELSQEEVGKRLGLSKVGYGHYERGAHPFTLWQLMQIARVLGRPVEYFLGLDTGMTDDEGQLLVLYRAINGQRGKEIVLATVREAARDG